MMFAISHDIISVCEANLVISKCCITLQRNFFVLVFAHGQITATPINIVVSKFQSCVLYK